MSALFWVSYAILWALVALLLGAVLITYYHFGQAYLNSREGRAAQGPALNEQLVRPDLPKAAMAFAAEICAYEKPALVLCFSDECVICSEILAGAESNTAAINEVKGVALVSGGNAYVDRWTAALEQSGLAVRSDPKGRIAVQFNIDSTPYCFGVDRSGVVRIKGNVNAVTHITDAWSAVATHHHDVRTIQGERALSYDQDH